jgi:hypothetical protein
VQRLQRELTSVDFAELWAEEAISPRGEVRADARHSIAAYVAARVAGNKSAKPSDFLPQFGRQEEKRQNPKEAAREAVLWARSCGAAEVKYGG